MIITESWALLAAAFRRRGDRAIDSRKHWFRFPEILAAILGRAKVQVPLDRNSSDGPAIGLLPVLPRRAFRQARRRQAIALLEVTVALAMIVLTSASTYGAMLILNRFAATTRAMNAAKTICEQYLSQAQKVAYNPHYRMSAAGKSELTEPELIPPILRATEAGETTPEDFPSGYLPPPGAEPFDIDQNIANGTHSRVTLQTNEYTAAETMPAWVFRNVTPVGGEGLLSVRFIVCFAYRSRMYSVQLDTMRAPDSLR